MNVKKFTAATSREALRKVRDALGPDAVILSNRPVDGIVEILALDNDDVASISAPAARQRNGPAGAGPADARARKLRQPPRAAPQQDRHRHGRRCSR